MTNPRRNLDVLVVGPITPSVQGWRVVEMNKLLVQQGAAGDSPSSSVDDRIPDVGEDSRGASRIVGLQGDHRRTVEAGTQTGVSRQQGRGRCGEVEPVTGDREVQIAPAVGRTVRDDHPELVVRPRARGGGHREGQRCSRLVGPTGREDSWTPGAGRP